MSVHKTSAWPFALIYVGLVVYASLYPFSGWRFQGIFPWAYLASPLPRYWSGFDVAINVLGYMPLGFLLALSALRRGQSHLAVVGAVLVTGVLSLTLESLQSYLPVRVASNVDLFLNVLGGWLGALVAWGLERLGVVGRWSRFRAHWFVADARGILVLLALWPLALLFPASVPFGLGQVMERLEAAVSQALEDTPFLDWLPVREIELQPLGPALELLCVGLGLLIPCLLGYCIIRTVRQRALFFGVVLGAGLGATWLSAALSYGPQHAWAWFGVPAQMGVLVASVLMLALLWVPRRAATALVLLALGVYLSLLNQAPDSPYFAQTLSAWEQGRFIRFHGLAQWLGWFWPYVAVVTVLIRAWGPEPKN